MAASASDAGRVAELTPQLRDIDDPAVFKGALEAVLQRYVSATDAGTYANSLVTMRFDVSDAIRDVDQDDLEAAAVPRGHRKLVLRAIFSGSLPAAMVPMTPVSPGFSVQPQPVLAQGAIGMLKECARTELLAATGATHYYEPLWGHLLLRANFVQDAHGF